MNFKVQSFENNSSSKPKFWTKSEECAIILFTNICGNLNAEKIFYT